MLQRDFDVRHNLYPMTGGVTGAPNLEWQIPISEGRSKIKPNPAVLKHPSFGGYFFVCIAPVRAQTKAGSDASAQPFFAITSSLDK